MATKIEKATPKNLSFEDVVVTVCFHPYEDIVASGCIDGNIFLHSYKAGGENVLQHKLCHHKKACRTIKFSPSGNDLHTASKDKSLCCVDIETGQIKTRIKKAHESAIYSLLVSDENFLVTGDDDGVLKVWDMRTKTATMEMKENDEFISDMVIDDHKKIVVASSGDGTLSAFNIRRKRMDLQSEYMDSELLSLAVVKNQQKVVCGSGDGIINVFNWGEWGNISDRFPGHPMSIDCMVTISSDIVCTGSEDGMIRAVNILPNRFIGVVGEHDGFPVESLSLSHDRQFIASCSHDQRVKFWSIGELEHTSVNTKRKANKSLKSKPLKSAKHSDFFSDLAEDKSDTLETENKDDDDDSEDDSDSSEDGE
ncbi:WD repeat-containing protein 55-like isoform X2 [Gigantopelta aegis]|uniref:WD repeat-containing protein 55-like isoform X2 n=1 Tax=Gigantopelta aegis TaxID=1735272 RepID=UPI001B8886E6|nr:WD repeat-containing protein 55-like isoform X2 [Gigantopelta aegis]